MKSSLFYLIFGGLLVTIMLQAIMFASMGLQSNHLKKDITDLNIRFDKIQNSLDATEKIIVKINSFIDEPLPQNVSPTPSDPENLLSPENLRKTLENETI
jgi:hypothetical protein